MSIQSHFERQATACAALGSAFTAALLRQTIAHMDRSHPVSARILDWPDQDLAQQAVALRFAGALHALVLQGKAPALAACYPPHELDPAQLWQAVETALAQHQDQILHWLDSAPQTNEPRRATALILAALQVAQAFPGLPLRLSELGASAGLNLQFDRMALQIGDQVFGSPDPVITLQPDWTGPLPDAATVLVAEKRGADINPLDLNQPEDLLRLQSYLWPDQPDRLQRLRKLAALPPAPVDRQDAGEWLTQRLATAVPGQVEFVYHTIAWQYFPPETARSCEAALHRAAERATDQSPLAWLSFEMDDQAGGAPVILQLWPGNRTLHLGRMCFHGRWFQAQEETSGQSPS